MKLYISSLVAICSVLVFGSPFLVSAQTIDCPTLSRTLYPQSSGEDVRSLQKFLVASNVLNPSYVTGYFGAITQSAVQTFQRQQNIVFSGSPWTTGYGLVGVKTRSVITMMCRPPSVTDRPLKIGMSGSDVFVLQKFLREKGFFTYPTLTGYFGPVTEAALKRYQSQTGLLVSGEVAAGTQKILPPTIVSNIPVSTVAPKKKGGGGGGSGSAPGTAPVRFDGSPTGSLAADTASTTIALTTNEASTCRYATSPTTPYTSMVNTFSTTGSTAHSQVVTGLSNGTSYTYYVRCQDLSGNKNTTDYAITFSVASPADTTAPTVTEVTPVSTPATDTTPSYTFNTTEDGTITYGGSCSSATTVASSGNNTITFSTLSPGTYSNCTIRVTDAASNISSALSVSTFTVDSSSALLVFVAGQSNARKSNTSALEGPARYASLASLGDVKIWDPVAVDWVDYTTATATTRTSGHRAGTGGTPDRAWGTEAEFIYRMRAANDNRPVFIVKEAVNGMSMAVDWQPSSGNRWVGLKGQIDAARPTLAPYSLAEITLWNQGEADANDAPSTAAYATNFDNFMDNWRSSISPTGLFVSERLRPLGYDPGAINNTSAGMERTYDLREDQAARLLADGNATIIAADWYQANWDDLHPSDTWNDPTSGVNDTWISGLQTQATTSDHGIGQRAYAAFIGTHNGVYGNLFDAVPTAFDFIDVTDATAGALVSSNSITPVFERRAGISVVGDTGAQYRLLNWDDSLAVDWTATTGTIDPLQKLEVRVNAGASENDVRDVTVTIGGVAATFTVTTGATASYLAETENYIDALIAENGSDPWNATKKAALDDFIDIAKNGATPFWTKIQSMYIGGLDPVAAARVDVKRPGTGGTGYSELVQSGSSGMPGWTDNQGWTNGASSGYGASFGFNPSTLDQNDIGIGGYFTTRQTSSSAIPDILDQNATASNVRLQLMIFDTGSGTTANIRLNSGAAANLTGLADTDGFYHANRSGASAVQLYGPAGTLIGSQTTSSVTPVSTGVYHGRATSGLTTNAVLGAQWVTNNMTAGEVQAFRDALVVLLAAFD